MQNHIRSETYNAMTHQSISSFFDELTTVASKVRPIIIDPILHRRIVTQLTNDQEGASYK